MRSLLFLRYLFRELTSPLITVTGRFPHRREDQRADEPKTDTTEQQATAPAALNGQASTSSAQEVIPPTPTYTYTLAFDGNHADVTDMPATISVASEEASQTIQIPDADAGTPYLANSAFIG